MAPHQLIWPLHQTLEILAESGEVPADVSIEALGLLGKVNKPEFALMTEIIVRLLTIMKPANAMLQSKTCNTGIALELMQSVITSYKELRNDESFAEFAKKGSKKSHLFRGPRELLFKVNCERQCCHDNTGSEGHKNDWRITVAQ